MDLTSNVERFLDAQISLIVVGLHVPGSESMVFDGIFPSSFQNLTVAYSGKDLFTSSGSVVVHVFQSCIVKTKSAIAIMQNVFCSVKA